jgi:branched-chain amino acid transport system substrate-binding protein
MRLFRRGSERTRALGVAVVVAVTVMAGCSETGPVGGEQATDADSDAGNVMADGGYKAISDEGPVIERFPDAQWFQGDLPAEAEADDPDAEPVKVGFIGINDGPIAALPELLQATETAVEFVNAELGGVDGHPIELVPCSVSLSPESSQRCAREVLEADVVAVLGGINVLGGPGIALLEEAGVPYVGGVPVGVDEMTSPISFQFSGGTSGAFAAFAADAAQRVKAKKVGMVYVDYGAVADGAHEYGAELMKKLGVDVVVEVTFPLTSTDVVAPIQKALDAKPDALIVGAADTSCAPALDAIADLELDGPVYMVGACADKKWLDQVGIENAVGTIFNIEGRLNQRVVDSADTEIYNEAVGEYGPDGLNPASAATVSFRSTMNLWAVLNELGADATPEQIIENFRGAVDEPSFDGHPYTCDGEQVPDMPALCSPQQVLAELVGPNEFVEVSDGWIDVPELLNQL